MKKYTWNQTLQLKRTHQSHQITQLNTKNPNTHKIPTLHEIAGKVARLEKRKLDEKQYIAYEMIACTFLLGLIHDGNDPNATLYSCLGQSMGSLVWCTPKCSKK